MYRVPPSFRQPRRPGAVAIFVAVCLTVLLAIVAIALDGGILMSERRHAQAVADAAARSAAIDLYMGHSADIAKRSALGAAAANGYSNDGETSIVTPNLVDADGQPLHGVWIPPVSGDYVGNPNYVEVVVQWNQSRSFSSIFGSGAIPVRARAVARGFRSGSKIGVLLLNPNANGALTISGSSGIQVNGSVIINSTSATAAISSGSAGLNSTELDVTGNYSASGSSYFHADPIKTGVDPTPDFLSKVPVPDPTTMPIRSSSNYKATSGQVLQPGVYIGGITIASQPNVTLAPGIYYLQGGGFTMSGGSSSLSANGVMLYNGVDSTGATGAITLSGGGAVTMTPPGDGTYKGMAIFQDRASAQKITLSGGSTWDFTGTVYAAKAHVDVSGGSGATMGSQYVSDTLTLSGPSTFSNIDPSLGYGVGEIGLVE